MGAENETKREPSGFFRELTSAGRGIGSEEKKRRSKREQFVNYLLDTNVVSEWMKPRPNPGVVEWLADADEDRLFLSVATLVELRYGVERLAKGQKRNQLEDWLETDLKNRFEGRVLGIDEKVAGEWGRMLAKADAAGRPMGAMDGFQAATAMTHGLTLVTPNANDFSASAIKVVDPWKE
jgi:toxin FitB